MALGWFEQDNFERTAKEVLIIALKERGADFYKLDPAVQNTLLAETMQEGVQQALQRYMNMKATIEETAASKIFHEMVLKEIYRERGKTLPTDKQP
jgi:hypothetical protein